MTAPNWNKCSLFLIPDVVGMKDIAGNNDAVQATISHQPTLIDNGINIKKSLEFSGLANPNNSHLIVPDTPKIQFTGDYTCIFVAKFDHKAYGMGFSKGVPFVDGYSLYVNASYKLYYYNNNTLINMDRIDLNRCEDGYSIVGLSCDGTNGYGYINGEQVVVSALPHSSGAIGEDLHIGSIEDETRQFDGDIQYLIFFDYALSPTEHIQLNKQLQSFSQGMPKNKVTMELKVDAVDRWEDISGHGNHYLQTTAGDQPAILTDGTMFNNGKCYDFDGIDNFLYKENAVYTDVNFADKDITFDFWFKIKDQADIECNIFNFYNAWIVIYNRITKQWEFSNSGTNGILLNTVGWNDYMWHNFCVTINDSTGIARLYMDGNFDSEDTFSGLDSVSGPTYIGGSIRVKNVLGCLVRPRIHNYCASAFEVASQYKIDKLTLKD